MSDFKAGRQVFGGDQAGVRALFRLGAALGIGLCLGLSACGEEAVQDPAPVTLRTLSIAPAEPMVVVDETIALTVTGSYSDGSEADIRSSVQWSVQDRSILRQTAMSNEFRGLKEGLTTVQAQTEGITTEVRVRVLPSPVVELFFGIATTRLTLEVGETTRLEVVGRFASGASAPLEASLVTWSSSDPSVLTIDEGAATGVSPGQASISAAINDITASIETVVTAPTLVGLELGPMEGPLSAGRTRQLFAMGRLSDGSTVALTSMVEWSSDNVGIAEVSNAESQEGLVTARGAGTARIRAHEPESRTEATLSIEITAAVLESLRVTPSMTEVPAGDIVPLGAVGTFSDGTQVDLTRMVSWASSDTSVAEVSNSTNEEGLVRSKALGSTTISVTDTRSGLSSNDSNQSAVVTVSPPVLRSLAVDPPSASIPAGLSQTFTASGRFSDGSRRDLSSQVNWSSSSPMVASLSMDGRAQGLAQGFTTVTAVDPTSGISSGVSSAQLTVRPAEMAMMSVSPRPVDLVESQTIGLTATATFTDNTVREVSGAVTWSSNSVAASVDGSGQVAALAVGTATVTATDGVTGVSASTVVEVEALRLVRLSIAPSSVAVPLGVRVQFEAEGSFNDGVTRNRSSSVVWSSNAPAVLDVRAGVGRALASGLAEVTATEPLTQLSARATAVVTSTLTLSRISVSLPSSVLLASRSFQATALGTFSDGQVYDVTSGVTWSSSVPAVATVSNATVSNGRVTAVAVGTTTISASTAGGIVSTNSPRLEVIDDLNVDLTSVFTGDYVRNTGDTIDIPVDRSNFVLATEDVAGAGRGLPDDGVFPANSDHPEVRLAATNTNNGDNGILLSQGGTVTINIPSGRYREVQFYGFGTQGTASASVQFNYSDGTSRNASFSAPDWFDDPAPTASRFYLINNMDRFSRTTNALARVVDPAVFGFSLDPASGTRSLVSITLRNASTNNALLAILGLLAVAGN